MIYPNDEAKSIEDDLKAIIKERHEASFDPSRLTPATEMHEQAKRLLGEGIHVA
jgi:hypothetical protein